MKKILLFTIFCGKRSIPVYFDANSAIQGRFDRFQVKVLQQYSSSYTPEKITYTGVTIGGVHTGGFSKQDAYYTTSAKKTSYGTVEYFGEDDDSGTEISEVVFPKELAKIAKDITGYDINGNGGYCLHLLNQDKSYYSMMLDAIGRDDQVIMTTLLNSDLKNHAPYDKCYAIARFLNRVVKGEFLPSNKKCEFIHCLLEKGDNSVIYKMKDFLQNPSTEEEIECAKLLEDRVQSMKKYKIGKTIYTDKKKYLDDLSSYVLGIVSCLCLIAVIVFLVLAAGNSQFQSWGIPGIIVTTIIWIITLIVCCCQK